jgi:transcriptional repressor NrdR
MLCPHCKHADSQVLESRDAGNDIRRRRECLRCKSRFTTYERIEKPAITVVKKNGDAQRFDPEKIRRGVLISCKNRPVTSLQVDELVQRVEDQVYRQEEEQISSRDIGNLVCQELEKLDKIAYLRFSSVCRAFDNIDQFQQEIRHLH